MTETAPPRAVFVAPAGAWPADEAADRVTLPYDLRHRRRIRLTTDGGAALLLDLDRAAVLAEGDGLHLGGGGWVAVHAAVEPLLAVRGADARHLARLAWHLGNRHVPCEVQGDRLLIRPDPVLAAMLQGQGAEVVEISAPFQPERGAYHHAAGSEGHR